MQNQNPTISSAVDEAQKEETVIAPGGPRPVSSTMTVGSGQSLQGGTLVATGQNMKQDGTPATDTDVVLTPGGWRQSGLVHHLESGTMLERAGSRVRKVDTQGTVIEDFGEFPLKPMDKPLMPDNVRKQSGVVPGLASGWIVYASWTANVKPVSLFTTTWVVPPAPATQSGQTIFLFNGIQNSTNIFQPVLQWGASAAGGGNYWSVASWYVDGTAAHSTLVRVNPGQTLVGVMTETAQSGTEFSYESVFTGIAGTSLTIKNVQQLTWCVETLECYGLTKCSDYPNTSHTQMKAIEIKEAGAAVKPAWAATNAHTDCKQHVVVVSDASPGGEVDIYYN